MKIGIFSGSFNPIHLGHTRLAAYIRQQAGLDEVWLMVSPNNPLKAASGLMDEKLRYHLAELATAELEGIRPSDFEFHLPKPSYTIHTLEQLTAAYPQHQFSLIIGSDNMAIFHKWKDWQRILALYPIIVYPREGDDLAALKQLYPMMHVIEGAPLLNISATEIRAHLQDDTLLREWLHPDVATYLRMHKDEKK
ncbi:MAG: nicotinate (nicotinamide) nucleotide adenylyltransferase [Paludibacteraceae bacterium]